MPTGNNPYAIRFADLAHALEDSTPDDVGYTATVSDTDYSSIVPPEHERRQYFSNLESLLDRRRSQASRQTHLMFVEISPDERESSLRDDGANFFIKTLCYERGLEPVPVKEIPLELKELALRLRREWSDAVKLWQDEQFAQEPL